MALLKKFQTGFGDISIIRDPEDGSLAYYQNGCFHSQATKDGISLCAYAHVIVELIRQTHARNILVIGCAGGTVATMLRRLHCKVAVVDINPMAFVIARQFFQLPDDVRCIRRDGINYLRTTRKKYDSVVVDVFDSDNNVPAPFKTESFFRKVTDVLTPHGIMIMNVITKNDGDRHMDAIGCHAEKAGMSITLFDWPGETDRNSLIVGGSICRAHIPSGHEPKWIRHDLRGLMRRKTHKHTYY
jgi:spermidine synthase